MSVEIKSLLEIGLPANCITLLDKNYEYQSRPPYYTNLDAVPGKWHDEIGNVFHRKAANLPPCYLAHIQNCIVFGNGFVLTSDGFQIREFLRANRLENYDRAPEVYVEKSCILLRKPGDSNYGHWLVELCTRIQEFRKLPNFEDYLIAVPKGPKFMRELRARTLEWLGVPRDRIYWLDNNPVIFKEIVLLTPNSIHSHTHDSDGLSFVRDRALQAVSRRAGASRLYVARSESLRRRLVNEQDLLELCKKYDFEVVYPENLSIDQQVSTFSNAEMIIGVSGAALTNMMFSPNDCRVLSLLPNCGHEFFFWDIANIIGQEFSQLFGQAEDPQLLMHSDFSIDIERVHAWMDNRL